MIRTCVRVCDASDGCTLVAATEPHQKLLALQGALWGHRSHRSTSPPSSQQVCASRLTQRAAASQTARLQAVSAQARTHEATMLHSPAQPRHTSHVEPLDASSAPDGQKSELHWEQIAVARLLPQLSQQVCASRLTLLRDAGGCLTSLSFITARKALAAGCKLRPETPRGQSPSRLHA